MNNAADEIVILSDALEALRLRTEELEQKLDTTAQPLAAASVALGGALDGIKALQFHVRDSNLGALSGRIEELRASVAEKIAAFSTQLVDADKRLESEQRQNVDGLRVELGAIGSAVAALSKKFDSELARIETDAKAEFSRIEQIKLQVGPEGRSLNPRGTFVDGETYNRLDVVSWLGSSYIAAVDGVTEKPSRNSNQWQVLASRGGGAGGVGDFASLAGVAQINQGGTGQTTRAAALNALLPSQTGATQYVLLTDGSGNVSWGAQPVAGLPSQTSNGGKLLTTDGTNASWSNAVTVSGSNATVTGTLTANGQITSSGGLKCNRPAICPIDLAPTDDTVFWRMAWESNAYNPAGNRALYIAYNGSTTALQCETSGVVKIPNTTASTSTSSGALIVSGGVGIAKALFTGESTYLAGAVGSVDAAIKNGFGRSANGYSYLDLVGDTTYTDYGLRMIRGSAGANAISEIVHRGTGDFRITTNEAASLVLRTAATAALTLTSAQQVQVNATTASTSTSTGALVVSGGVGVAGAGYFGSTVDVSGSGAIGLKFTTSNNDAQVRLISTAAGGRSYSIGSGATAAGAGNGFYIYDETGGATALLIDSNRQVQVKATTASSSTTTGALVVSGGVGVAGAVNTGGGFSTVGAMTLPAAWTAAYGLGLSSDSNVSKVWYGDGTGKELQFISRTGSTNTVRMTLTDTGALTVTGNVGITATTASTSTGTGALTCGGGVGVAGAMYIGGLIECSSASGIRIRTASGTAASFAVIQTGNATWEFKSPASDSSLVLRANDTTNALQLTNVGNGIFAGSVKTAAPSGGTAAAWKLGTVASVSPTSPNRTIEVDIGGTIYYIHAKTTNN